MRLSPQQRVIAWRLALQPFVTHAELREALWGWEHGPEHEQTVIYIQIHRLRSILPVPIKMAHGHGYSISERVRPVLLDLLAREIAANVFPTDRDASPRVATLSNNQQRLHPKGKTIRRVDNPTPGSSHQSKLCQRWRHAA